MMPFQGRALVRYAIGVIVLGSHRASTVDRQFDAGDELGVLRGEEYSGTATSFGSDNRPSGIVAMNFLRFSGVSGMPMTTRAFRLHP